MLLLKIQKDLCHPKSSGTFEKRAAEVIISLKSRPKRLDTSTSEVAVTRAEYWFCHCSLWGFALHKEHIFYSKKKTNEKKKKHSMKPFCYLPQFVTNQLTKQLASPIRWAVFISVCWIRTEAVSIFCTSLWKDGRDVVKIASGTITSYFERRAFDWTNCIWQKDSVQVIWKKN